MIALKLFVPVVLVAIATGLLVDHSLSKTRVLTIRQASGPSDSRLFALEGKVYPIGANAFRLVDATGTVEMQTCPVWYKRVLLNPGEKAVIIGEKLLEKPTVKGAAFVIAVYTIESSESGTIVVRDKIGKPPWALQKGASI